MPYVITEPCVGCKDGTCVEVCPVDCIETTEEDPIFYIDPTRCIECDVCLPVCPVDAIFKAEHVPGEWAKFTDVNREYFEARR